MNLSECVRITAAVIAGRAWMVALMALTSCSPLVTRTFGEKESGYTYVPVDPFAVQTIPAVSCQCPPQTTPTSSEASGAQCKRSYGSLFESLPDNTVRMLVEQFNASGSVTYGAAKVGAQGESYRVTIDYINADTTNFAVRIYKEMRRYVDEPPSPMETFARWISGSSLRRQVGGFDNVPLLAVPDPDVYAPDSEIYTVTTVARTGSAMKSPTEVPDFGEEFNIPIYIGIGLRITANVEVIGSSANISGIGVIGAEAEANKVRGSLVVQTLGVNGKSIAAALPIQSELNRTTAQNAIVSVGSIKALLYASETVVSPRVVGVYLPFPGGKALVNAVISELSKSRVVWERPCPQQAGGPSPTDAVITDASFGE